MQTLLEGEAFEHAVERLAEQVREDIPAGVPVALVGVRRRGDALARRLAHLLQRSGLRNVECGALDITLYRDDLAEKGPEAVVRSTEIPFDVTGRHIVLVDDVLYTGRTVRAALDAITDLGRPVAVRLAVLVDRAGREMPIHADYAAVRPERTDRDVRVHLRETDGQDKVELE